MQWKNIMHKFFIHTAVAFVLFLAFNGKIHAQIMDSTATAQKLSNEELIKIPDPKALNGYLIYGKVIEGDTVMHMDLPQVTILPPYRFKNNWQRRRYSRLVRYVKKVYPYAQLIKQKYYEIEDSLQNIEDSRARRKFVKKKEKELRKSFENQLVKLTVLQGRILLKLVDRETGHTTFEVLEDYKGKFSAIFWQSVARIFGSNLKEGYDARGDERMIEDIIIRIENGQL